MMEKVISKIYWREVVSTSIYVLNRVQIKKGINTTCFELWYGYAPNIRYFKIFSSRCYIL